MTSLEAAAPGLTAEAGRALAA
eukprot:SAG11_NODE_21269_length_428_cov_1.705167_1_plen_21_part_01